MDYGKLLASVLYNLIFLSNGVCFVVLRPDLHFYRCCFLNDLIMFYTVGFPNYNTTIRVVNYSAVVEP